MDKIQNEPIFIENSYENQYINRDILFHKQSLYIHAVMAGDDLEVRHMSKNATDITGYTEVELVNCSLSALMTEDLRLSHGNKLKEWLK